MDTINPHAWGKYWGMFVMYVELNKLHERPKHAPYEATHTNQVDGKTKWYQEKSRWDFDRECSSVYYQKWNNKTKEWDNLICTSQNLIELNRF